MTVRVVIADDHPFLRKGLAALFESSDRFSIAGEAADGLELITLVKQERPDLVVTDLAMPHLSGLEAVIELKRWCPACHVIVVTGLTAPGMIAQIDAISVAGLFLKSDPLSEVQAAIDPVLAGRTVRSDRIREILADHSTSETLSGRERQVLMGIARGDSNARIADRLGISANTVDKHRTNMMRKLDVHSAAELLAQALRDGLLDSSKTL